MKTKIKKGIQKVLLKVSYLTAVNNANTTCGWWQYQPKQPKSVKKLRKF